MDTALAILPWLLPPFIGAIIGYGTNRIAIQMLFRPRNAKYLLGIRVPLTPGIIPKSRDELAHSVGRAVARELLSADAIRVQLASPPLRASLTQWISGQRQALMGQPIALRDGSERELFDDLVEELLPQLMKSPQMAAATRELSTQLTTEIGRHRLRDLISSSDVAKLTHRNLIPLLAKPEIRTSISNLLNQWMDEQLAANHSLEHYVPAGVRQTLDASLQNNMPAITNAIVGLLQQPSVRDEMIKIGRALVQDTVANQGFLSRTVIRMSGKEAEFIEQVPQTVDSMLRRIQSALNSRNLQDQLLVTAQTAIERALQVRVHDVFGGSRTQLYQMVERVVNGAFDQIEAIPITAVKEVTDHLYTEYGHYTLAEAVELSAGLSQAQVADSIAEIAVDYLRSDAAPAQMAHLIRSGLIYDRSLALSDFVQLSDDIEYRIDDYLTERLLKFLHDQIPILTGILDVEQLVTERINAFDTVQVERMVLDVTGRHLKWINYFGAALGAIIGLIQVALYLMT